MVNEGPRQRGQLILVGAIALAIIIASLSMALNTTMTSEVQPRGNAVDSLQDGQIYRSAIADALVRMNGSIDNQTHFRENVSRYGQILSNTSFRSRGATINLTHTGPDTVSFEYETDTGTYSSTINISKVNSSS